MTPDPYQGTSGGSGDTNNPQSWNRYAYTTGDPVNWIDPEGEFQEPPPPFPGPPVNPLPPTPVGGPDKPLPGQRTCPAGRVLDTHGHCVKPDPKDLRDPATDIECNQQVLVAMQKAWALTGNGTSGMEAGFVLTGTPTDFNIEWLPLFTGDINRIAFNPTLLTGAFAVFHVHPNGTGPDLSTPDKNLANQFNVDIYSESSQGLFGYNPADKSDTQLADFLQWANPCQYK